MTQPRRSRTSRSRRWPLAVTFCLLVSCSSGDSPRTSADPLAARLLAPDDLAERWEPADDLATSLGGRFCELQAATDATGPSTVVGRALVRGETLLRQTLIRYPQGQADSARAVLEQHTLNCPDGPELGLTVAAAPTWSEDVSRLRMEIDVADVPLVLDLAVWQQQDVIAIVRLTYPKGVLEDPLAAHEALMRAADKKLRRGDDGGAP
jgi:hypothetical protein